MSAATREALRAELSTHLSAATSGRGRLVVVTGEAGIGKTTLARELAEDAGVRVLWGACEPLATTRPLLPLHDWGRAAGGPLAAALAGDERGHDLFAVVLGALAEPTLAVVEDVHWADDATLDLLLYLGRRLPQHPCLLLATMRVPEPHTADRVDAVLRHVATLPGNAWRQVPPLSVAEVGALTAGAGLDPARVHAVTGGNPFFVTELVDSPTAGIPTSVREAVLSRVALLRDAARTLLQTVSVVPDRAEIDLFENVAADPVAALDECERAGLLVSDGRTLGFRHELAREAVERSLSGATRRQRHRAVLARLLVSPRGQEARIGYHADAAGAHAEAVEYGVAGARISSAGGAHRQAATQLERARAHLAHVDAHTRTALELLLVEQYLQTGPLEASVSRAADAVASARELDDADVLAQALALQGRAHWLNGDTAAAYGDMREALQHGERAPGSAGQLAALAWGARLHMLARDFEDCLAVGWRAIELAARRGDERMQALAINAVGTARILSGAEDGMALMNDGFAMARRCGDDDNAGLILCNLGSGLGEIRVYDDALAWLARCERFCGERDNDITRDYVRGWQARIALERGEWTLAGDLARALVESPSRFARLNALTVRGRLAVRRGASASEDLRTALDEAIRMNDVQRVWPVAAGLAEAAHATGDELPAVVLATFADALTHSAPWGWASWAGIWSARAPWPRTTLGSTGSRRRTRRRSAATGPPRPGPGTRSAAGTTPRWRASRPATRTRSRSPWRPWTGSAHDRTPTGRRRGCEHSAAWCRGGPAGPRRRTRTGSPRASSRSTRC